MQSKKSIHYSDHANFNNRYLHLRILHWSLQTLAPMSKSFLQDLTHFFLYALISSKIPFIKSYHSFILTLVFVVSPWLTATETSSVCLVAFIFRASSWLFLSSETDSLGLLVPPWLPVGSSLNCTVYGWSWLTIQSCCPGFILTSFPVPTTAESIEVGFTPSFGRKTEDERQNIK